MNRLGTDYGQNAQELNQNIRMQTNRRQREDLHVVMNEHTEGTADQWSDVALPELSHLSQEAQGRIRTPEQLQEVVHSKINSLLRGKLHYLQNENAEKSHTSVRGFFSGLKLGWDRGMEYMSDFSGGLISSQLRHGGFIGGVNVGAVLNALTPHEKVMAMGTYTMDIIVDSPYTPNGSTNWRPTIDFQNIDAYSVRSIDEIEQGLINGDVEELGNMPEFLNGFSWVMQDGRNLSRFPYTDAAGQVHPPEPRALREKLLNQLFRTPQWRMYRALKESISEAKYQVIDKNKMYDQGYIRNPERHLTPGEIDFFAGELVDTQSNSISGNRFITEIFNNLTTTGNLARVLGILPPTRIPTDITSLTPNQLQLILWPNDPAFDDWKRRALNLDPNSGFPVLWTDLSQEDQNMVMKNIQMGHEYMRMTEEQRRNLFGNPVPNFIDLTYAQLNTLENYINRYKQNWVDLNIVNQGLDLEHRLVWTFPDGQLALASNPGNNISYADLNQFQQSRLKDYVRTRVNGGSDLRAIENAYLITPAPIINNIIGNPPGATPPAFNNLNRDQLAAVLRVIGCDIGDFSISLEGGGPEIFQDGRNEVFNAMTSVVALEYRNVESDEMSVLQKQIALHPEYFRMAVADIGEISNNEGEVKAEEFLNIDTELEKLFGTQVRIIRNNGGTNQTFKDFARTTNISRLDRGALNDFDVFIDPAVRTATGLNQSAITEGSIGRLNSRITGLSAPGIIRNGAEAIVKLEEQVSNKISEFEKIRDNFDNTKRILNQTRSGRRFGNVNVVTGKNLHPREVLFYMKRAQLRAEQTGNQVNNTQIDLMANMEVELDMARFRSSIRHQKQVVHTELDTGLSRSLRSLITPAKIGLAVISMHPFFAIPNWLTSEGKDYREKGKNWWSSVKARFRRSIDINNTNIFLYENDCNGTWQNVSEIFGFPKEISLKSTMSDFGRLRTMSPGALSDPSKLASTRGLTYEKAYAAAIFLERLMINGSIRDNSPYQMQLLDNFINNLYMYCALDTAEMYRKGYLKSGENVRKDETGAISEIYKVQLEREERVKDMIPILLNNSRFRDRYADMDVPKSAAKAFAKGVGTRTGNFLQLFGGGDAKQEETSIFDETGGETLGNVVPLKQAEPPKKAEKSEPKKEEGQDKKAA